MHDWEGFRSHTLESFHGFLKIDSGLSSIQEGYKTSHRLEADSRKNGSACLRNIEVQSVPVLKYINCTHCTVHFKYPYL